MGIVIGCVRHVVRGGVGQMYRYRNCQTHTRTYGHVSIVPLQFSMGPTAVGFRATVQIGQGQVPSSGDLRVGGGVQPKGRRGQHRWRRGEAATEIRSRVAERGLRMRTQSNGHALIMSRSVPFCAQRPVLHVPSTVVGARGVSTASELMGIVKGNGDGRTERG